MSSVTKKHERDDGNQITSSSKHHCASLKQIPICQLHLIISEATNNVWNLTVYLWTHKLQFVESSTNNRAVVVLKATLPYYGDLDQNLNEFIWFECINVTSEDIGTLPFEDFLEQFNNIDLVSMENNLDQNANAYRCRSIKTTLPMSYPPHTSNRSECSSSRRRRQIFFKKEKRRAVLILVYNHIQQGIHHLLLVVLLIIQDLHTSF